MGYAETSHLRQGSSRGAAAFRWIRNSPSFRLVVSKDILGGYAKISYEYVKLKKKS
jgi:hypothetical protein